MQTLAIHSLTAWGQWVVQLLQHNASLTGGSGQWDPCNTLLHYLGVAGRATAAMHYLIVWGQLAVHSPQAVRHRIAGVALPTAPTQ